MPRLPWAGLWQAVGLKFLHLPAHRLAAKLPLQRIPERHPLLAAHAEDARRLLLLAELEKTRRIRLRWPASQPVAEP